MPRLLVSLLLLVAAHGAVAQVLTISYGSAVEGNSGLTPMTFAVTLAPPSAQTVTVDYRTLFSAATAQDFVPESGTLTFSPGVVAQTITIDVRGETLHESDEVFVVELFNATNATIATTPQGPGQALGTIVNDDAPPTIAIDDASVLEGLTGRRFLSFGVRKIGNDTQRDILADFMTTDGTALAGSDYQASNGTLRIASFIRVGTVVVPVIGDAGVEPDETLFVTLSNARSQFCCEPPFVITDPQATGTILNDDPSTDLVLTQTASTPNPRGGGIATLTLRVRNDGPIAANNVVLTHTVANGVDLHSAAPSQGSCSGNPVVACSLGTLAVGSSATVTLALQFPTAGGFFVSSTTVTATEGDPTPIAEAFFFSVGAFVAVPALSEWALIALAMMLAALAATRLRA